MSMSLIPAFQKEFESEVVVTRKMLSLVPNDKYDWKPHEKSMTIKGLVTHLADIFCWCSFMLNSSELDFTKMPYQNEEVNDTTHLMSFFERKVVEGRTALASAKEEQLTEPWSLRNGDLIYSTNPKADVIRMSFSQIIHHRAQLGVFLRLLDIPIPGSYGPSADDMSF